MVTISCRTIALILTIILMIVIQPIDLVAQNKNVDKLSELIKKFPLENRPSTNIPSTVTPNETRILEKAGQIIVGQFLITLKENQTGSPFNVSVASVNRELGNAGIKVLYAYNNSKSLAIEFPTQITPGDNGSINGSLANATAICNAILRESSHFILRAK